MIEVMKGSLGLSPTGGRAVCHFPFVSPNGMHGLGVYDVLSSTLENN